MALFYPFTKQNSKDDITNKIAFYKSKNGKELGLSGKLVMLLPPGAPPELPDAIGSFTTLRSIDISQNSLRSVTPRIVQLQGNLFELNASHNMLTDVSEIGLLTSLQSLDLSNNCLRPSHITPLSTLINLKELNLSHNLLYDMEANPDSSALPNLEVPDTSTQPSSPLIRRASLGPTSLNPRPPSTSPSPSPQRKLASAPPSISTPTSTSPPPSPSPLPLDTSATSSEEPVSSSPPRFVTSPVTLLITPTPVHPHSPPLPRSRTPSPTPHLDPNFPSPTPANTPVPSPSPSPLPFARPPSIYIPYFAYLEILILSSNQLNAFPDVHSLVSLAKLDLSDNKIVEVPMGIHTQLVNLKELNLQGNLIEKLPPMMKSLKKLLVDKNPLHPAFLVLAQNRDLLNQLQATPETDTVMQRSSSDSAIPAMGTTPPTPIRSSTPPPNGFLSRIFRKDHSVSDISPKGKSQSSITPMSPDDSLPRTTPLPTSPDPQSQIEPQLPNMVVDVSMDAGVTESGTDATNEALKKKRAFSLPQSPNLLPPSALLFGVPPPLSFPTSPPSQPTPTEIYLEFVKKLKQTQNIKSSIDSFVARIKNRALDPDDLQAALRDFVRNTHTTLAAHPLWRKASVFELQEAELHLQEYVLEHLYDHIFAARQEDKEKDQEIAQLIKRFYFITPEHLDIKILREHEDIWRRAEQQILQINSTKSVRSKMRCVVRMCRDLIAALARAHGDSLGADTLLPHLIFVILHANPPHLHSNIVYMTRFSESEASETIYYVTQLVAALYFIEHIDVTSLNIDPDEFHARMNETSRVPTARTDTPIPARASLTRSGNSLVFTPDVNTLVRALDLKRKEYAGLAQNETAKWVADNDALINQCVGLSREVLPTLPTSLSPLAPIPPRFENVRLENLRAVEIPQLFEDYQRLASLFHLFRTPSSSSLSSSTLTHLSPPPTPTPSLPTTTPTPSLSSSSSPLPSPIPSPQPSPRSSPSLVTFTSPS